MDVKETDAFMKGYLKFMRAPACTNPKGFRCQELPSDQLSALGQMVRNGCYNNAFNALSNSFALGVKEKRYVLGWFFPDKMPIPIEHAWIKLDGVNYDPTAQLFVEGSSVYYTAFELDMTELLEIVNSNGSYAPMLHHVSISRKISRRDEQGVQL